MFNFEEYKAMKVSSLTPPDLYPSTTRSMPVATGLAQGASGSNEAGQPKAISSVTASTGSQDTAAGQPKSSAIWVNYQHGVNLAEAIEPGSSKRMTRAELIAYPGKKSAESVTGEQELLIASTRVAPTLDWAVASGILVEKTSYTQAEIQTAISALDQHMEDMAKAATSLTTPVPMRKDYFTGTQWVSPIKGHDDPDNKKYSVALYDDQKFGDDFKADLVSKKSAYGMLIKQLISTLPVEDRIAIEHGKVGLYALKPPGTGDDLERDSFLIKAFHDGKTTVYEVNPGLGTARRRDDFKGVFTGASAVGKKQLPDGTDAKDFTVWGKPSIQGKQYQPKADQKQGVQPDNTPFNSKIYTLDSLSEFPASSAGTAEPLAPNTLSSERSNNIGNILSEKLFYIKDLDLLHMAEADPGRVTQEEKDDRANYQKFREERESRRDFLKGFVPFWQGIEAIVAGRPIEGIGKILIDILSFMLPVGKVASTALKEGAQIIKSALPQFSKFAKRMLGFTRNPGVPGIKWEGGIQGLKWTGKVSEKIVKGGEQFRVNAAPLPTIGSGMREIEFAGSKYFAANKPDAGDGVHYLLRVPDPKDPSKLVSSSIVAKPNEAGLWLRRGVSGGGQVFGRINNALSMESLNTIKQMENTRQFVGIMNVNTKEIHIGPSTLLGNPGSEVEKALPKGMRYMIGSVEHAEPIGDLVKVNVGGVEKELTGHAAMVHLVKGRPSDYVGFSGIKRSDGVLRLKWNSRTLNPEHASFKTKHHLGNPGEGRDYVLNVKYQDQVVKQFEKSGYEIIR